MPALHAGWRVRHGRQGRMGEHSRPLQRWDPHPITPSPAAKNRSAMSGGLDSRRGSTSERDHVVRTPDRSAVSVTADNPIRKPEDDVLGRTKVARSFAEQVLSLDVTEGVVLGVLGP